MTHDHSALDQTADDWVKSSYSGASNGNCLECAPGSDPTVPVRDSKRIGGDILLFHRASWADFVTAVSSGSLTA